MQTKDTKLKSETIDLSGVPETMLWPLWNRAAESQARNPLITDPISSDLVSRIDYDFESKFDKPNAAHAIRARYSDDLILIFLKNNPDGIIVALGEGLDSAFWRIGNDQVHWYSVDVPESIEVRESFLPSHEHMHTIACSALDDAWLDEIPNNTPLFISASGLFMYFTREDVVNLLRKIVTRFKNVEFFFDTISEALSKKTTSSKGWKITPNYTAPPMPFGVDLEDIAKFAKEIPGFSIIEVLSYTDPYPERLRFFWFLCLLPRIRKKLAPGLIHARVVF